MWRSLISLLTVLNTLLSFIMNLSKIPWTTLRNALSSKRSTEITMPDFPLPVSGTAWAAGGVSGKLKGSQMRGRRGRRFAPRQRKQDTMWAPCLDPMTDAIIIQGANTRIVELSATKFKTDANGIQLATGQSCKILRFDGHIRAFMDPTNNGVSYNEMNRTRLAYWWVREKLGSLGYGGSQEISVVHMSVVDNFAQIMRRRDVLKWGILDVYGPLPDAQSSLPVTTGAVNTGVSHAMVDSDIIATKRAWNFRGGDTLIPWPRLPKGGLNLNAGECLSLYGQCFGYLDTIGGAVRPVNVYEAYRVLITV